MSGYLDNKQRIMDIVLTNEGRRQLANGELRVRFATFSDAASCYEPDPVSGSADIGNRIYFEASSLPQDNIVPEADDSGRLMPFGTNGEFLLHAGQMFQDRLMPTTASMITGSNRELLALSGSEFTSMIDGILTGSLDNLHRLRTIGTWDPDLDNQGFSISPTSLQFALTNRGPILDQRFWSRRVSSMESIFNDPRLSQLPNFRYLPPINRIADPGIDRSIEANVKGSRIADYPAWGNVITKQQALGDLLTELGAFEKHGFMKRLIIEPTSKSNNLLCQFFEMDDKTAKKLDVIHFGRFNTSNRSQPVLDIFFAGKVLVDDNGSQTFIHLFTLVFD